MGADLARCWRNFPTCPPKDSRDENGLTDSLSSHIVNGLIAWLHRDNRQNGSENLHKSQQRSANLTGKKKTKSDLLHELKKQSRGLTEKTFSNEYRKRKWEYHLLLHKDIILFDIFHNCQFDEFRLKVRFATVHYFAFSVLEESREAPRRQEDTIHIGGFWVMRICGGSSPQE